MVPGGSWHNTIHLTFFLIGIIGSGVKLGLLITTTTNRPIVREPGDYDDGEIGEMMIGNGNRCTRSKPALVPLSQTQTRHALPGREPGPSRFT
jgi:hypothetical protein